jgi:hypothetical protein
VTGFVINARPFTADSAGAWDDLVRSSVNATFLQTRRFLGYHADRFVDRSLMLEADTGRLVGIFPAAASGSAGDEVESHPGLTHGGILHDGSLSGERSVAALKAVIDHYRHAGVRRLTYKVIPFPFRASPSQDDAWALNRLRARLVRSDLSTLLDLIQGPRLKSGRSDDLRKARRAGLEVVSGSELLEPLWQLIADVLQARHNSRPVHSLAELTQLAELFPEQLELVATRKAGELLAGAVLFHFQHCTHTQYLASSPQGQAVGALTLALDHALGVAAQRGKRWFSFGTSTTDAGLSLNAGLYDWKSSFGGSGLVHETYALELG